MPLNNPSRREFLRMSTIGGLGAFTFRGLIGASQKTNALTLYVGTYTSGASEGIYVFRMNRRSGELKRYSSIKAVNPSFLAIDAQRRHLYAVNEIKEFAGKSSGAVSAFSIEPVTGKLNFLNQQPSLGADPCHLTLDRNGKFLLVANYTGGNLSVLPIQRDGRLGQPTDFVQHKGSSVKEQQKGPHAHCIIVDSSNRHALAADLGIDKVLIYRFDATTGKLKAGRQGWAQLDPGAGPRHLTIHPGGRYAYVINELNSTMSVFRYNGINGALRPIETVATLPEDFSGTSYCADLHVSASGKFLYGSNRGHDSIVVFAINERTGTLTVLGHASTQGKWPRNFTIDPTGRFLLVANERSDTVVTFRIDPKTGRLNTTGHMAEVPAPVCLKFA
jgi:6-phosphogluconolactonase